MLTAAVAWAPNCFSRAVGMVGSWCCSATGGSARSTVGLAPAREAAALAPLVA